MKTRVTILFMFRRGKAAVAASPLSIPAEEVGRIVCRITARKRPTFISTNLSTCYGEWDSAAQRVQGKKGSAVTINAAITKLRDQLTDIWADLERQGRPVTAQAIARIYRSDGALLDMRGLFGAFLAERKQLVGIEIAQASYVVDQTRQRILEAFLQAHRLTDLRPEEFTHNLADKLLYWCLKERSYQRSFANKVVKTVSQCLRWAVRRELLEKNPLDLYQYKAAAVAEIKYLNVGEIQALTACEFPHPYLNRVRDCFIFQCWTGLAYADLAALNVQRDAEYHRDAQGNVRRVLRIRRQKSTINKGYECIIPLLPEPERILAGYADKLPVLSGAYYNRILKEVGQFCDLPADKMTSHVGRKTAGVMMLNAGIRMETVSKFLGHSSVRMTEKIYAKILDTTVVDDFGRLFGGGGFTPVAAPALAPQPEHPALRPARRLGEPAQAPSAKPPHPLSLLGERKVKSAA